MSEIEFEQPTFAHEIDMSPHNCRIMTNDLNETLDDVLAETEYNEFQQEL